ncbi:hypothetical protein [Streptomyces ardesiacus]|uniref:hypothetical protein n=1 Tax=Streptomyces ardesiacus TaxID=285564 RepID=UPI00364C9D45
MPALKGVPTSILKDMLGETRFVYEHDETPDHIKHAAAVLINFYGAELDARMAAKVEGQ